MARGLGLVVAVVLWLPIIVAPQRALSRDHRSMTYFLAFWGFVALLLALWRVGTYRAGRRGVADL